MVAFPAVLIAGRVNLGLNGGCLLTMAGSLCFRLVVDRLSDGDRLGIPSLGSRQGDCLRF